MMEEEQLVENDEKDTRKKKRQSSRIDKFHYRNEGTDNRNNTSS